MSICLGSHKWNCYCKKLRINTAVVRRIQHYLNQEILLLLYNSMVKSHLLYCILIWCNGNKTLLQTLQRAANRFIRLIFTLNYRESVKNTMQQNHESTINQLFENELASFLHRYDHGKLPLACQVLLKNNSKSSKTKLRQIRSNSKYFPAYCRINLTMQSI